MSDRSANDILDITAQIVTAYASNNSLEIEAVPSLVRSVYRTLSNVENPDASRVASQAPAVPIKRSVFPDYIVCLEDGKKMKMLKRHLQAIYDMTPSEYRTKWGLPRDYPMVAPSYAILRSTVAKGIGLGRRTAAAQAQPEATQIPARRARGSKG